MHKQDHPWQTQIPTEMPVTAFDEQEKEIVTILINMHANTHKRNGPLVVTV